MAFWLKGNIEFWIITVFLFGLKAKFPAFKGCPTLFRTTIDLQFQFQVFLFLLKRENPRLFTKIAVQLQVPERKRQILGIWYLPYPLKKGSHSEPLTKS